LIWLNAIPVTLVTLAINKIGLNFHRGSSPHQQQGVVMLSVLLAVLIICVVGAICFWAIEKFVNDGRLANLLKLLVVLICLGAILQRVLPLAGINWF
jgi:uncharacterized membrane protein YoaK (UPF0700 family)